MAKPTRLFETASHKTKRVVFDTLALHLKKPHRPACFAMNSTIGVLSSKPCG